MSDSSTKIEHMDKSLKKIVAYFLVVVVLLITVISILGVWEIISLEDIAQKIIASLLIIFAAAAVLLFIFSVLIREDPPQG